MSKQILPLLLFLFCSSCNTEKEKFLSEKKFTQLYLDSLKELHPEATHTIKKDLEIHVKSNDLDFTYYLNNAYTSYKNQPDLLPEILATYLRADDLYKKKKAPVQKDKIVPVIKDNSYLDEVTLKLKENNTIDKPFELVYEKYNDKLIILYGEDNENGIAYFTKERLREAGLNKDSLFPIALENLNKVLPEIERKGEDGLYIITAGGNYEASLILLTGIWTKKKMPVDGQIIIAIPTRDLLFVTGSNNTEGIKKIKAMAQEAWESGPYQLIPDLFRWNGKKFEPYN
jgi:uncharacterized protein YtpQ (UPF0354 family)